MILQDVLNKSIQFFKEKNFESARLDAELLIAKALCLRRIDLYLKFDQPLKDFELDRCRDFVRRRSKGEPVAYIIEEKDFFGETYFVDRRVLVPRPETELLVEEMLLRIHGAGLGVDRSAPVEILDLGCGSGCLGLSILKNVQTGQLTLVDLSAEALAVSKINAEKLGLWEQCGFLNVDANLRMNAEIEFDVIVANPPYIDPSDPLVQKEVREFEPHLALFATRQGFSEIEGWAKTAILNLKPKGWLGFEIGYDQGERAKQLFESLKLEQVQIIKDLAGYDRHVVGRK